VASGAGAGLVGTAETDCACTVALTPAISPRPKIVDLSKLCILELPLIIDNLYFYAGLHCNPNDNCAAHKCISFISPVITAGLSRPASVSPMIQGSRMVTVIPSLRPALASNHHIDLMAAASGADEPGAPIEHRRCRAVLLGHLGRVGVGFHLDHPLFSSPWRVMLYKMCTQGAYPLAPWSW
jgi:hypothetical protein